ncbi:MAG: hypothetical protein M0Z53_11310 [Thermaerobacter sp.]|nr:hypothetical protein [Thermaerobacter sp.]
MNTGKRPQDEQRIKKAVQHMKPPPGIVMPPYPARRDRIYRMALLAMAASFAIEAAGRLSGQAGMLEAGQWLSSLSVWVAAWSFLVWLREWRWLVRGLAAVGLLAMVWWPLGGWAGVLSASAVMAAKEHHCFHFVAARLIPWASVGVGLLLLAPIPNAAVGAGFGVLSALWVWLAVARQRLPLFSVSGDN